MKKLLIMTTTLILSMILFGCSTKYHNVTIDFDNGEDIITYEIKHNKVVKEPNEPAKKYHKFDGFYVGSRQYNFNSKVVSDLNIKAVWTK